MQQWFQMMCIWLEVDADAELYTLQELHFKMSEMSGDENVYSIERFKRNLQEKYGNKLYFAERDGRSNVVCFCDMADYILNDLWQEEGKSNKHKDAERIVVTAAKLIMSEIREKEYDTSVAYTLKAMKLKFQAATGFRNF